MKIGKNLNFDGYVAFLCKKAGTELVLLARLSKFMSLKQSKLL